MLLANLWFFRLPGQVPILTLPTRLPLDKTCGPWYRNNPYYGIQPVHSYVSRLQLPYPLEGVGRDFPFCEEGISQTCPFY